MADANTPQSPPGSKGSEQRLRRQMREDTRRTQNTAGYAKENAPQAIDTTGGYTNTDLDERVLDEGDEPDEQIDIPQRKPKPRPRTEQKKKPSDDAEKVPNESLPEGSRPAPETEDMQESGSAEQYARSNREETAARRKEDADAQTRRQSIRQQQQRVAGVKGEERLPTNRLKAMFRSNVMRDKAAQATGRTVATVGRVVGQALLAGARALLMNPWVLGGILAVVIIIVILFLVISAMTAQLANSGKGTTTNAEIQNPGAVRFQDPTSKL